jgi:hypothetical protein
MIYLHEARGADKAISMGRASDLGFRVGAGEGNRTLMTSLEGWGSAIELRPHGSHTSFRR